MARHAGFALAQRTAILDGKGVTGAALRRAVEARTAALCGGSSEAGGEIPPELREYVDAVALHAYAITAEEIANLQAAGYSEDAVFEISVSAAVGAGLARLERGLAALKGGRR